jgi:hypothetical protein
MPRVTYYNIQVTVVVQIQKSHTIVAALGVSQRMTGQ